MVSSVTMYVIFVTDLLLFVTFLQNWIRKAAGTIFDAVPAALRQSVSARLVPDAFQYQFYGVQAAVFVFLIFVYRFGD